MKILNKKKILLISIFMVAFLIRLAIGLYSYKNEAWNNFGDDVGRQNFSNSIIEHGFIPDIDYYYTSESVFAPVIPTILAAKTIIFVESWLPVFILNALL
jgi:hypothetical protein